MAFHNSVLFLVMFLSCVVLAALPINAQFPTSPCTSTMLTSFTPCLSFLANSSGNGTTPSAGCCTALKTLMSNGTACLCVIATGGIPFQIPINPNATMSLPRACNMAAVPFQCKASSPPAAAPGPSGADAPSSSPTSAPSPSRSPKDVTDSQPMSPTLAPEAETVPTVTPTSPSVTNSGRRQNPVTPSAAPSLSYGFSPLFLLVAFGAIGFILY
ncbi:non-specific lipid transfer protein GPI-anchored 20-like [Nicotiana tabacum]|uniref:Non-specific lipid transfer protein GPI-anchored 20-like n=2 Tax=Nicotiana TaxID=4085 RepID=A0A1S4CW57_TOBAC|nr:PREDICTED: non-specific lipid-transfer protein-like protein At2g13820 [Nicotiana sylvestris]XP_016505365.1 PREDICTED: non-specific lipid-transfer protein-like protein At2g13820 [Nicotiana tabacum]